MRLRPPQRFEGSDLAGAGVLAVANLLFALSGRNHGAFAAIVASLVVLAVPGYAVQAALFPGAAVIGWAERLLLSVGISLCLAVLGGFVLNWIPSGLTPQSWAILLMAITVCSGMIAIHRRRVHPGAPARPALQWRAKDISLLGLAVLVTASAITIAVVGARQAPTTTFTQLWLLPGPSSQPNTIQLGVRNMEAGKVTYYLRLAVGSTPIGQLQRISLSPNQTWATTVTLPGRMAADAPVEADLFRGPDLTHPYRHVILWPQARAGT